MQNILNKLTFQHGHFKFAPRQLGGNRWALDSGKSQLRGGEIPVQWQIHAISGCSAQWVAVNPFTGLTCPEQRKNKILKNFENKYLIYLPLRILYECFCPPCKPHCRGRNNCSLKMSVARHGNGRLFGFLQADSRNLYAKLLKLGQSVFQEQAGCHQNLWWFVIFI